MPTKLKFLISFLGLALLLSVPAQAQIVFGQPASGDVMFFFSSWTLDYDDATPTVKISQSMVPLRAFIPLGENTEGLIYVSAASSELVTAASSELETTSSQDSTLKGMSDVRMQVSRSFAGDQMLLSLGLNLPTGKTSLSFNDEVQVLEYLAADFIDVPLRRLGEGFGFSVLLGGARMLGDWRAGGSIMYRYNGSYDPYEGVTDFDPGDLISFNLGFDRIMEAATVSVEMIYSLYGSDQLGGSDAYKQSSVIDIHAGYNWHKGVNRVKVAGGYVAHGRNTAYVDTPASETKIYGDEFWLRAIWGRDLGKAWRVTPAVNIRTIAANEQNLGSSTVFGLGTTVARPLSDQVGIDFSGTYFIGGSNIDLTDDEVDNHISVDLTGYQIRVGLTANL
jgi:hypothetical protein